MKLGCAACLDDNHDDCYSDDCRCLLDTNHDRITYDSSIKKGEYIQVTRHSDNDRIDIVSTSLIREYDFKTAIESDTIFLFTGKRYENKKAEAIIKEQTEKRIVECTERDCLEVIAKIKRKTYKNLQDFDSDPNLMTLDNWVFNITTQQRTDHSPTNLSKVLILCRFIENVTDISETKFWKYLTSTCTIDGKLDEGQFDNFWRRVWWR